MLFTQIWFTVRVILTFSKTVFKLFLLSAVDKRLIIVLFLSNKHFAEDIAADEVDHICIISTQQLSVMDADIKLRLRQLGYVSARIHQFPRLS